MKAQTLAISVPNLGCDKNCPYCVSKMTGYMKSNFELMKRNLPKVVKYAEMAQVNNVIFTSKGEPFYCIESQNMMATLMEPFADYPIEIQTNGLNISEEDEYLFKGLYLYGVNTIAISIDKYEDIFLYEKLINTNPDFIWRSTVNLVPTITREGFEKVFEALKAVGFKQASFREITVPNFGIVNTMQAIETMDYIAKMAEPSISNFLEDYKKEMIQNGRLVRKLSYGATLYDYKDMSITYFDYCIQDSSEEDDVRSLIFQEDGHLYSSWNSKASLIF